MAADFGAFGKIPTLGDFFRLQLTRSFVEPWDLWLQSGILSSRRELGENWNACYMSAPIWRFTLPIGQAGPKAISGVLIASVDRVGRQFPLTLASPIEIKDVAAHHFTNTATFEFLEELALQSLDDTMSRDLLLEGLSATTFRPSPSISSASRSGGLIWQSDMQPVSTLAAQCISNQISGYGLWSMALEGDHRLMACSGLPNPAEMVGLFDLNASIWKASAPEYAL